MLHYFQGIDTLASLLSTSIPAELGTSYVIVINGFKENKPSKIPPAAARPAPWNTKTINFEATLAG